ncbi:hypothetical protein GNIT_1031 [Glaciecola nitratireducens FR1064]|uniref:Uncharacterized protein n=1 Tax=Glaciecola nitratireducens (strain JCM 12485 / KCTC 12276 / FR1064) TaxID=1085623 RepID=G4QK46_GLANF|nr:hypothetical protein GNIT_1031 [Glaciecola nitratireducens FR1064]
MRQLLRKIASFLIYISLAQTIINSAINRKLDMKLVRTDEHQR